MIEPLFKKTILCDQCNTQFDTYKMRSSTIRVERTDSDFCSYYKGENPFFYDVRVCPNCGSATTEQFNVPFHSVSRAIFMDKIGSAWRMKNFGGERSIDDALQTYKLALLSAQIREERALIVAQMCHRIAWIYRYKEDVEEEQRFLHFALKSYTKGYVDEKSQLSVAKLMYIIGELHARTGDNNEAIRWFDRVIKEKAGADPRMTQMARDRWSDLRSSS